MAKLNARMQSNFSACFHAGECTVVKLSGKSSNIFFYFIQKKLAFLNLYFTLLIVWGKRKKDSICYCIVSSSPKKSFARRHIAHVSFHILSWLSCGYWISIMGKFWRRIVKKTSTYNVIDWRWRHESRTTKTSSSLSFCYRFYPYSVNTKFEINGFCFEHSQLTK